MMRLALPLVAACVLTACSNEPTPAEKAAADARAVAMVEKAQEQLGPVKPVKLEQVSYADIDKTGLSGAGCSFAAAGEKQPLVVTIGLRGFVKTEGRLIELAGDAGSPEFPYGTRGRLTGKEFVAVLRKNEGDGRVAGDELTAWPATLTLRDANDRVVFSAAGDLSCGA